MNSYDLFDIIGDTPERYVLDTANVSAKVVPMRKCSPKRIWLIAAIIALILCVAGCAVAYVLSLDQLILGTEPVEDRIGETEPRNALSLQGYAGSDGYKAAQEWFAWKQNYDPDLEILLSIDDKNTGIPEEYIAYDCYTQEMKEKIDEICEKYDLELLGPMLVDTTSQSMFDMLQINGVLRDDAQAELIWSTGSPGYFFRNGAFKVEFSVTLTGENNPWPFENVVSFRCHNKAAFDDVTLGLRDITQYEQWNYTTSSGVETLLVKGPEAALIIADIGDYFIVVGGIETKAGNILDGEHAMSREGLEAYAEIFDFSIQPQRLTEEQVSDIKSRYDAYWSEILGKQEEEEVEFQEFLGRKSYEDRVKFHLKIDTEATRMGYTFYDFDKDGVEELVIGRDGYIEYIYTEKNGETSDILGWPPIGFGSAYLTSEGTLVYAEEDRYQFFHVENGECITDYWVEQRDYWGTSGESPWRLCYSAADDRPITEEEYRQYCTEKKRVVLEMLPLIDYPLAEQAEYNKDGRDVTLYNVMDTYEGMIRDRILNPVEKEPDAYYECQYVLLDLDGDGVEELILDEGYFRAVYTKKENKAIPMYSGSTFTNAGLNICKGNIIEIIHEYPGENKSYCYYRMSGTTGEMVEYLCYDAERNPLNPWFRSADGTGQDLSLEPVSKAEFDKIRQAYSYIKLDWKPIEEYPLT